MIVEKVMTNGVDACFATDSLSDAAAVMWRRDCGAVPVIDTERRVVGIITDRDICMALATRGAVASEVSVGEVMSSPARTCTAVDDAAEAIEIMAREQIRRLPVLDGRGRLAGMLSVNDIVTHSKRGKGKKHVSHREAMNLLKAISRPHKEATAAAVKRSKTEESTDNEWTDEESSTEEPVGEQIAAESDAPKGYDHPKASVSPRRGRSSHE